MLIDFGFARKLAQVHTSMNNNDILRRVRYTFDFHDEAMQEIFALGDLEVEKKQVIDWLRREEDPEAKELSDFELASFLNGLITHKRGAKDGPKPVAEQQLTNNLILRKLKIALNLKNEDMIEIYDKVDMRISPHEISAFFRKPGHPKYRLCKDQFLRVFLQGLNKKYRSKDE